MQPLPPSVAEEERCVEIREQVARRALAQFIGGVAGNRVAQQLGVPDDATLARYMPRVAVCGSGGGCRAMLNMVGFLDGLSKIGLLSGVTYCAGLSGSTWCLLPWISDPYDGNPFHGGVGSRADPWFRANVFTETAFNNDALCCLLKEEMSLHNWKLEVVLAAVRLCGLTVDNNTVRGAITALFSGWNDANMVQGWARFLSELLLEKREQIVHTNTTQQEGGGNSSEDHTQPQPAPAPASARRRFQDCASKIHDGSHPIPICTAIAQPAKASNWDWVDISPFCVRRNGEYVKPTSAFRDSIPELMAVCGSAFAADWKEYGLPAIQAFMPHFLQRHLVPDDAFFNDRKPIVEGLLGVAGATGNDPDLGNLRDAGIDFNVPFPAFKNRKVDVLIVIDASGGATNCEQLRIAIEKGHANVRDADRPLLTMPFRGDESLRVFKPAKEGDPVILYFLGNAAIRTTKFAYEKLQIDGLTCAVRQAIEQESDTLKWVIESHLAARYHSGVSLEFPLLEAGSVELEVRRRMREVSCQKFNGMHLLAAGNQQLPAFEAMFIATRIKPLTGSDRRECQSITVEDMWGFAVGKHKRSWLIEGTGGAGKTTFCKHLARTQGPLEWQRHFAAVVLVELQRVDPFALPSSCPDMLACAGITDELVVQYAVSHPDNVLWVFDSFDELELKAGIKQSAWVEALQRGSAPWVRWFIITSRKERQTVFPELISAQLESWSPVDLERYVDNFFMLDQQQNPQNKRQVLQLLNRLPNFSDFASTPIFCELVCTVKSGELAEVGDLTITSLLQNLVAWLWNREKLKRTPSIDTSRTEGSHTEKNEQRFGKCKCKGMARLCELAFKSFLGDKTFQLDLDDDTDRAVYSSGLVRRWVDSGKLCPNPRCEFIHRLLHEYFVAQALGERFGQGTPTPELQEFIKLEDRSLLVITANFFKTGLYAMDIFAIVLEKFYRLYDTLATDLKRHLECGNTPSVREEWRGKLHVDVVVELATLLGDEATMAFINVLSTPQAAVACTMENLPLVSFLVRNKEIRYKFTPWIFRLLMEPAAHFGNITLLHHLIERGGGHKEIKQALLAAYLGKQLQVIQVLQQYPDAGDMSLDLPVGLGSVEGVEFILKRKQKDITEETMLRAMKTTTERDNVDVLAVLLKHCTPTSEIFSTAVYHAAPRCTRAIAAAAEQTKLDLSCVPCPASVHDKSLVMLSHMLVGDITCLTSVTLDDCSSLSDTGVIMLSCSGTRGWRSSMPRTVGS
eukprot:TRINITY_DN1993_c0_g1_i7.p1 TRINITY_DN1993_c0_g1~~TRINITY_DN1993_c0_g1_i7.p1  ORF type:complete len:1248 (+),score=271.39 TRINITY_DN1993_c0_g1_i7:253-3996(+)